MAGRRHLRLRGAARDLRACSSTRTAPGCSPSSPPSTPAARSRARRRARRPARGRRHDPGRRGAPDRGAGAGARGRAGHRGGARRAPRERVREAVAELLCGFPVYRSYLPEGRVRARHRASSVARRAPARPRRRRSRAIHAAMLADPDGQLATRVQQTSGMVMAKGVEDTAFYRWNRFVALNEVGGDPAGSASRPPSSTPALAAARGGLAGHDDHAVHPRHQALRGRARPARRAGRDPRRVGAPAAPLGGARTRCPTGSLELLAWQSLVGAWPIPAERLAAYLGKAAKEAKVVTSHVDPMPEVDAAIAAWPEQVLGRRRAGGGDRGVRRADRRAGLVQLAGPEAAAARRARRARRLPGHRAVRVLAGRPGQPAPGRLGGAPRAAGPDRRRLAARGRRRRARRSCWSRRSALRLRRYRPELFTGYRPLPAEGPAAAHVVAFARSPALVAVATRLPVRLAARGGWGDTVLPLPGAARPAGRDVITGAPVARLAPRCWPSCCPATRWRCWSARPEPGPERALRIRNRQDRAVTDFAVWAPQRERVRVLVDGTRAPDDSRDERGLVARRRRRRRPRHRLRVPARRRRDPAARPAVAVAADGVHGRVARLRPRRASSGPTARGPAGSCPAACSTSCTSARSPRAARSTPRSSGSTTWSTLGVDLVEVLPVNAVDGAAQLGLRRRRLVRGAPRTTAGRTPSSASSTPATPAGSACCSTSSTTTSARPAPTSTGSARTSRAATSGARRSTSTGRTPSRCAGT